MLWSKVKTVFIIAFLILDIAFLVLMGITSAGSGLSADELSEIVTFAGAMVSPFLRSWFLWTPSDCPCWRHAS